MYFYLVIIFLFGLAIGSFLNVVIYRLDDLKSIIKERSHCRKCKKAIPWYDLIPLLSFVLLKGRCRYCSSAISVQYPVVELAIGALSIFIFLYFGFTLNALFYFIIFLILTVVFVSDLKSQMIPEEFVWAALVITLLGSWYFGGFGIRNMIFGGIIGGAVPGILVLLSKEKWMGSGDIKLGILLGALSGFYGSILMIFLAFVLGSIVGLGLVFSKKKDLKDSVPFAPFLITSGFFVIIWGHYIINWYLGNFYL